MNIWCAKQSPWHQQPHSEFPVFDPVGCSSRTAEAAVIAVKSNRDVFYHFASVFLNQTVWLCNYPHNPIFKGSRVTGPTNVIYNIRIVFNIWMEMKSRTHRCHQILCFLPWDALPGFHCSHLQSLLVCGSLFSRCSVVLTWWLAWLLKNSHDPFALQTLCEQRVQPCTLHSSFCYFYRQSCGQ